MWEGKTQFNSTLIQIKMLNLNSFVESNVLQGQTLKGLLKFDLLSKSWAMATVNLQANFLPSIQNVMDIKISMISQATVGKKFWIKT